MMQSWNNKLGNLHKFEQTKENVLFFIYWQHLIDNVVALDGIANNIFVWF